MMHDARDPPVLGALDLRRRSTPADDPEQLGGGVTGQHRLRPAGQDGSEVGGFNARRPVPDAVDAAMDAMQQAPLRPPVDRRAAQAGCAQLRDRHHPVLSAGDPGDLSRWG